MAAATTAITALAGIGLSANQAYESSQDKKAADQAAQQAKRTLANIREENPYADVQVPDITNLAFEQIARQEAGAVEALRGMGVEGAAQIVNVVQAGKEASLSAAETQAGLEYQRNMAEAEAQKEINRRKAERQQGIATGELLGATQASADAETQRQASLANALYGIGDLATGVGAATSLEAAAKRNERKQSKAPTPTSTNAAAASASQSTIDSTSAIYSSLGDNLNQILKAY